MNKSILSEKKREVKQFTKWQIVISQYIYIYIMYNGKRPDVILKCSHNNEFYFKEIKSWLTTQASQTESKIEKVFKTRMFWTIPNKVIFFVFLML